MVAGSTSPTELPRRRLGPTGLEVTALCAGAAALGGWPELYGEDTPEELAVATVCGVMDGPLNFLDTSANYAEGQSELRIGEAIRRAGGLPEGFVLSTKVDRDMTTGEFSGAQMRRSVEGSLARLGLDRVSLLHLHDPEHISFAAGMAAGGPVEELVRIRDEGLAEHIGVGGGPIGLLAEYLRTGLFEVLITHNRWTLADRSADALIDEAGALGVGVLNAAPYGGGILARGADSWPHYAYHPARPELLDRVRRMEGICAAADVPLAAAALQFSLRDDRIASTIVGVSGPDHVEEAIRLASWPIPEDLWPELEDLRGDPQDWLY
jgi:D-threo-aldose 1-dehydrogenase